MKPSKKINILFITTLLDRMGGAEKNLCDIVLNIDKERFEPHVIAFKGGELTRYLSGQHIDVSEINISRLFSFHTLSKMCEIRRYIKKKHIDLLVTYHHDADIVGGIVGMLSGVKVISSRRDMGYQLGKKHIWFYRLFNWLFDQVITVSDAVKNEIVTRDWIKKSKITTIRNGLDIDKFKPIDDDQKNALMKEFSLSPDKITIGMVASFRPIKGQMYLVEAVSTMKDLHDKIQVLIVGYHDTDYSREVQSRINELGLSHVFHFAGVRNDVPKLLNLFDVFVISSVNEGFSNAIIEAMAAGIAVVAADSGGNREAVVHDKTGLLFAACDSHALSESLTMILNDPSLIQTYGRTAKKHVYEKFMLGHMIEANETVYTRSVKYLDCP